MPDVPCVKYTNYTQKIDRCQDNKRRKNIFLKLCPVCRKCFPQAGRQNFILSWFTQYVVEIKGIFRGIPEFFFHELPREAADFAVPPCVISKACAVLPCLQGGNERRNRRHMGVCPCVISTERSERRNLWNIAARVLYSLFGNAICIHPSRGGAKTRSAPQGDPSRPAPLRMTRRGSLSPVIPSLSRDLYANIVKIKIEILRRRA